MTENLNKKPPKGILKSSSSFDTASCSGSGGGGSVAVRRNSGVGGSVCGEGGGAATPPVVGGCSRQCSNELTVEGDCCGGDNGEEYVHVRKHSKTAKFDEMNILETYHPATKTYGHMKIEEPKTPFNYYEDDEVEVEGGESSSQSSTKRRSKEISADELVKKLNECKDGAVGGGGGGEEEEEEESSVDEDEDDESRALKVKFESKRKAHYNEYYAVKLARKLMEEEQDEDEEDDDKDKEQAVEAELPAEESSGVAGERDNGESMEQDE